MVRVDVLDNPFIAALQIWEKKVKSKGKLKVSDALEMDKEVEDPDESNEVLYEGSDYVKVSVHELNSILGKLNRNDYKLLFIIMTLVEEYYNFNGALDLSLDVVNEKRLNKGSPFCKKTLLDSLKVLCTPKDEYSQPLLKKHHSKAGVFWVNPVVLYRGYKKILLIRYNTEKKARLMEEAREKEQMEVQNENTETK